MHTLWEPSSLATSLHSHQDTSLDMYIAGYVHSYKDTLPDMKNLFPALAASWTSCPNLQNQQYTEKKHINKYVTGLQGHK